MRQDAADRPGSAGMLPHSSGLFPVGPPRPSYREPLPVRGARAMSGGVAAGVWLVLFTLLGSDLRSRVWWLLIAALVAWLTGLLLARYGDRGVAVGVALVTGAGVAGAGAVVAGTWLATGTYPLR